jgi:signal peptidase I
MKALRIVRRLANLAVWALGIVCIGFFLAVGVGPRTGRYSTLTVLSGSMRPNIPVGAMVVITPQSPSDVRVGQVLTFATPEGDHHVVSHRVIEIVRGGDQPVIRTQGDANNTPDPWVAEINGDTAWRVRFTLPAVGQMIHWLRQPLIHKLSVFVAPFVLAVVWLIDIWRPQPEDHPAQTAGAAA